MIGWRFWVLLAVAVGGVLWATSSLVLLGRGAPSSTGALSALEADAGAESESIRKESREAMRDILRQVEQSE